MAEYRYSAEDRIEQLKELKSALETFVQYLAENERYKDMVTVYEHALTETERLLTQGFSQKQLTELGKNIPDFFSRHKEWLPPLEQDPQGNWVEPQWYRELERYLQPVLKAAGILSIIGYY